MGIPRYFHVITQTYPGVVKTDRPAQGCTDFFMDYNGAIHHVANMVLEEVKDNVDITAEEIDTKIMHQLWEYTTSCISIAKPSRMVHLCIDGVAPVAKLNQQRKRRYLAMFQNKQVKNGDTQTTNKVKWDRNSISPGTPFMIRLHAFLRNRVRNSISLNAPTIYLSTAEDPGEGEHKMFARIHALPKDSSVIIHGLDADLIMLSLMAHRPDMFLMREPTGFYADLETKHGFLYVDMDALRGAILEELRMKYNWSNIPGIHDNLYDTVGCKTIENYVVCCFLLGNDFLPHLLTISLHNNGYEKLLYAVRDCMNEIAVEHHAVEVLSTPFLARLFSMLANNEDDEVRKQNDRYLHRRPMPSPSNPMDSYPLENKERFAYEAFHDAQQRWRALYYKNMFHARMHETTIIADACKTYIQGVHWTYRYYKQQKKDARWYYPWGYPPTLRDLANWLTGLTKEDEVKLLSKFTQSPHEGFVDPNVQLCCIMPMDSIDILPKKVRELMTNPTLGCSHLFPSAYKIQTYLKYHLWECNPVLPHFQIDLLERVIQK